MDSEPSPNRIAVRPPDLLTNSALMDLVPSPGGNALCVQAWRVLHAFEKEPFGLFVVSLRSSALVLLEQAQALAYDFRGRLVLTALNALLHELFEFWRQGYYHLPILAYG